MKPALVVWLEEIMVFSKKQLAGNKKWENTITFLKMEVLYLFRIQGNLNLPQKGIS